MNFAYAIEQSSMTTKKRNGHFLLTVILNGTEFLLNSSKERVPKHDKDPLVFRKRAHILLNHHRQNKKIDGRFREILVCRR